MTAELVKLGVDDWARLEASQVRSLVTRMHKGAGAPFLATKVSALRSFCDWQVRQGRLTANPARGIVTPSRGGPCPRTWTWTRCTSCSTSPTSRIRWRCGIAPSWS